MNENSEKGYQFKVIDLFLSFIPILMNLFGGEKEILNDIKSHSPDFIVYLHRPMTEFGTGYFGVDPDCGKIIMDWVKLNYVPVKTFSPPLVKDAPYGIAILKKSSVLKGSRGLSSRAIMRTSYGHRIGWVPHVVDGRVNESFGIQHTSS